MGERKRMLVVSSGLSPAVVTESLHALAVNTAPAWVPHELHVITTGRGAELVEERLLGPNGKVAELCSEYGIEPLRFDQSCLHILTDDQGRIDPDASTDRAIARMGNLVLATLRKLTASNEVDVHLSLAGGRKTMSYFAGLALSLVGRPTDRLSHVVLSNPAFEFTKDFFYPPRTPRDFHCKPPGQESQLISSAGVAVTLSDVPFIPLRRVLSETVLHYDADQSLEDLVGYVTAAVGGGQLTARFDCATGKVTVNGRDVKFSPHEAGLYYVLSQCGQFNPRCSDEELFRYFELAPHMNPDEDGMRSGMLVSDSIKRLVETLSDRSVNLGHRLVRADVSIESLPEHKLNKCSDERYGKFAPVFSDINKKLDAAAGHLLGARFKPQGRHGHPKIWPVDVAVEVVNPV